MLVSSRKDDVLTARRACILGAIVEEYVETAAPVGSKAVRECHGIGASTATIRNEMCVLEQSGYIRQPHTSAGRVPEDKGYRTYVDDLMPGLPLKSEQLAWVRNEWRSASKDADQLFRTSSRVLSQLTSTPAMVMAPPDEPVFLMDIKLMAVSTNIVRLVYETDRGGECECLVNSEESMSAAQVAAIGEALARRFSNREIGTLSLASPETLLEDASPYTVPASLLDEVKTAIEKDRAQRVYVDGSAYALRYPEYQEIDELRPVVEALDEDGIVRRLLRPASRSRRLTVRIGHEQELKQLSHCSLIALHYGSAGSGVGALGVLGPTRLDYDLVVSAVRFVAERTSEAQADG